MASLAASLSELLPTAPVRAAPVDPARWIDRQAGGEASTLPEVLLLAAAPGQWRGPGGGCLPRGQKRDEQCRVSS